jgi:hypothetical protein
VGAVGRTLFRALVAVPILVVASSAVVEASGGGSAGAASGAPFAVALASCFQSYSAASGVSYQVRIVVDAYNLPPSADGSTNTDFYAYPDGSTYTGSSAVGMGIANGQGFGESSVDDRGGPYGYNVVVLYKAAGGTLPSAPGSADATAPVHVTLPDVSRCGSANVTSVSSPPGTNSGSVVGMASTADGAGYWMVGSDGRVYSYGDAANLYDQYTGADFLNLNKPIVGMTATPDGHGYWLVASDGGVFSYGDAGFYGSTGGMSLNKPIVGMTATADGKGYWLVASDGGIFAYGDAQFFGSAGSILLNQPIVGMAADAATGGYWLVAADGGVFSYNAPFLGSAGNIRLNKPIVGMEAAPDGSGYRFVASDGGVFCYGLPFAGSTGSITLNQPITSMAPSGSGGYWLGAADGGIFNFGTAFYGSAA